MTRRRVHARSALVGVAALTAALSGTAGAASADSGPPGTTITPVVGRLAAPRGIAFDGAGAMYVAESGVAGVGTAGTTRTGKVDKFARGRTTPTWSTTFTSLYLTEQPGSPADALGPEGLTVSGEGCARAAHHDDDDGCTVSMIMSESTPGVRTTSGGAIDDPQAGRLFHLDAATGRASVVSNVGAQSYRFTARHQELFAPDFPDANPYGVASMPTKDDDRSRTFVVDAAANTVSEIMPGGDARVVSYIPNETAAPFRDATPTCAAVGPDGYLYVGTLDIVANLVAPGGGGHSSVYRVDPNASFPTRPTLWATGLTTVTSCTVDRGGRFWATEMFAGGGPTSPPGDVVRIPLAHPDQQTRYGAGQLPLPGGIAQGPDGAMYVTVGSAAPGVSGAVMRLSTP